MTTFGREMGTPERDEYDGKYGRENPKIIFRNGDVLRKARKNKVFKRGEYRQCTIFKY